MSHMVRLKTIINDKNILFKALDRLGWVFVEGKCQIQELTGDIMLDRNLGLALQSDGSYELIGDPYYTERFKNYYRKEQELVRDLMTSYNIELSKDRLEGMGFNLVENEAGEVNREGQIQMVYEALD